MAEQPIDFFAEETPDAVQPEAFFQDPKEAPPANAEQIAAQAAFLESSFGGADFEEAVERNKYKVETADLDVLRADVEEVMRPQREAADKEMLEEALVSGDRQAVQELVEAEKTTPTMEDEVVANVAAPTTSGERMMKLSGQLRHANKVGQLIGQAQQEKIPYLDATFGVLGNIFLPGHSNAVNNNIITKALGVEDKGIVDRRFADAEMFNKLRDYYISLSDFDKDNFLAELYEIAREESGVFGDNEKDIELFFTKFLEYSEGEATLDSMLGVLDAALYPAGIVVGLGKSSIKGGNAVVAHLAGNTDAAAELIAADLLKGSKLSGIPETELIEQALKSGVNPYTLTGDYLKGADEAVKEALAKQAMRQDIKELVELRGVRGIGHEEYADLIKKYEDLYKTHSSKEYHAFEAEPSDVGITYTALMKPATRTGFASEQSAKRWATKHGIEDFTLVKKDDKFLIAKQFEHKFTIDDVSPFSREGSLKWLPNWLRFPLQSIDKRSVTTRVLGVHQEDFARQAFERLYKDAVKGVNKKSIDKVYDMLARGDANSIVYDVQTLALHNLSPAEQAAYYKIRTLRDISYVVHNRALTDRLTFLGHKQIDFTGAADEAFTTAGKVMDEDAAKSFVAGEDKVVLDLTGSVPAQRVISATEDLKSLYTKGDRLVATADTRTFNGQQYDIMLVKGGDIKTGELTSVLPYRVGEFGRQYTDPYFVVATGKGFKNGKAGAVHRTMRTAPSKKAADEWAENMNQAMKVLQDATDLARIGKSIPTKDEIVAQMEEFIDNPEEIIEMVARGELDKNATFSTKFDRELSIGSPEHTDNVLESMFSTGRLFTSQRGERLKSVLGGDAPIKSPKEAMAAELSYVSRFANLAVWRETAIKRILETYGENLKPIQGGTQYERAFFGETVGLSQQEIRDLQLLRDHVRTQIGIPSEEALKARQFMIEQAEALDGGGWKGKLSQKILSFRHSNPTQALRTAVYHSYLGLFNVAQLMVQANGAIIAASVNPKYGLKAAISQPALRMGILFDSVGNKAALEALAKKIDLASMGYKSADDFIAEVQLIRKSGILNSIKSSALHYVKEGAVDLDTHMIAWTTGPFRGLKKTGKDILKGGLIPFNRGEEFSRMVAMGVARREWQAANPGKSILSRQAMDEIVERQEVLTLGMSRANIGRIQQGWVSVPFQFAQYSWKLAESLLGKNFTGAEKFRILGGMTLMYGSAGMGVDWLLDEAIGDVEMDKATKIAYTQGLLSYMIYKTTGAETAVGTRIGPMTYFSDNIKNLTSGELSALAAFTGPSGSFLSKEAALFNEAFRIFRVDEVDLGDKGAEFLHEALKATSAGYSNMTKYYHASIADGWLRTKSGSRVAQVTPPEAWLAMFGFGNLKEWQSWKARDILVDAAKVDRELANGLSKLYNNYYQAGTQIEADKEWKKVAAYIQSLPLAQRSRIADMARKNITADPFFDRNLSKIQLRVKEETVDNPLMPDLKSGEQ